MAYAPFLAAIPIGLGLLQCRIVRTRLLCGRSMITMFRMRSVLSSSLSRSGMIGGIHLFADAAFFFFRALPEGVWVRTATERSTTCPFRMRRPQAAQNFGELVMRQADKGLRDSVHSPTPRFWG